MHGQTGVVLVLEVVGDVAVLEVPVGPTAASASRNYVAVASTSTIASSAAVASSAVSIIVLIHCIQRCCYQRLDLILDSHAHSLDLHLHVVDDGLTVSQC
jgi:hypothetical protein